jgi:hypothetical protein
MVVCIFFLIPSPILELSTRNNDVEIEIYAGYFGNDIG